MNSRVSAPKETLRSSRIDATFPAVGGLIVVKVVTSDDLSKVELWLEEEVLVGLVLDETKDDDKETLAAETPIVDEELLRPRPRTFTMDCIMIV